jgi:uncharacterized protein
MARVAIIGGGAAGMGCAKVLVEAGLDVTLFEELSRLGGHCHAVAVPQEKHQVLIDAGVSDFNRATSPEVRAFMTELGLAVLPVTHDTTCTTIDGHPVWTTRGGARRVIDGVLGGVHDEARFFGEIDQFAATCVEVTAEARFADWSARRYLDEYDYGPEFRRCFFNPRAGGSFPMPDRDPEDYFIRPLVAYWQMEGMVGGAAERMVVEHGMHAWPAAFHIWFENKSGTTLRLEARVVGVARRPRGIRIRLETVDGAHESLWFDHVVFAANPHAIRSMLEDPSTDEAALLGAFQWQRARVAVHRDAEYVCSDPGLIAAYNFVIGDRDQPETRPTLTLYPRRLATLVHAPDVFVTINPHRAPRDVIANRFFVHPALSRPVEVTTRRLAQLQGTANTWFAGGWLRVPHVHEQALASGLEVGHDLVATLAGRHGSAARRRIARGYLDALRDSPIFASLDACLLEEVRVTARPFELAEGQLLVREGEVSPGMLLVIEGEALGTRAGKLVTRAGAGSLIGDLSILDGGPSPLSYVARTPVTGWYFDRAAMDELRREVKPGVFAFLDQIARTQMRVWRELVERRFGTVSPADAAAWTEAHVIGPASGFLEKLALPEGHRLRALLWEFPPGALVIRAGEASNRFLIVIDGRVEVTAVDGTPLVDAGPGDLPGILAVIDGGRQPFSFVAREPTLAAVVDADRFRELRYGGGPLAAVLVPRVHRYLVERYRPLLEVMLAPEGDETMIDIPVSR